MSAGRPRTAAALSVAAVLVLAGCSTAGGGTPSPGPSGDRADGGRMRAITLPSWAADDYNSPKADGYVRDIAGTGARWVTFTPTWYQKGKGDAEQHTTGETASDASLRRITGLAHAAGLKVMLKPHVDLEDGSDRAEIHPVDRARWLASYEKFITHYAEIARETGCDQFVVGTELAGTSRDSAGWKHVIAAVRARFRGPLTYAANYDEYRAIGFWGDLDVIGIDAYWPLSSASTADPAKLRRAWRPVVDELTAFASSAGRRILFTEAGYTSQRGTTTAPYSWTVSKQDGSAEQAAAYQALLDTFQGEAWWAGVCWWMWDDWPGSGETAAKLAYSPHGKPAEQVLKEHWIPRY